MLTETAAVRGYFKKLGLEPAVADIYLALHTHGPQSISELARNAKVERTRIYRLIDTLLDAALIELEAGNKRGIIKAAPIANLRTLINQRRQDLRSLEDELELIEQVLARNSLSSPAVQTQMFYGPEGLRQMLQRELQAKTTIVGQEYRPLEESVGKTFMAQWWENFDAHNLSARFLYNSGLLRAQSAARKAGTFVQPNEKAIFTSVDTATLSIQHSMRVFDRTIHHYFWQDGEIYGLAIQNEALATSQRQLFEKFTK
jgi:DNA-binding MarR family transcriptional regulator